VRIDTIDEGAGTVTLARGCADTVPVQHAAGDRIYFYGDDAGTDAREYVDGELVHAKLLTRTSTEVLDAGSAPDDTVVMNGRQARPYPPGNFQIGGVAYPLTESGALAMTWSHRDRVLQADTLIDTLAADIGPEAGTTYTVRIYADGVLEHTETGITGNSFSYTGLSDGVLMRIELFAVRDTLESWQTHIREFLYITTAIDFRITTASDIRITTTSNVRRT